MSLSDARFGPSGSTLVDYTKSLDCIHCGLCLRSCPTYIQSGRESSSPRGRIHLMRAVAEARLEADRVFAEEMDYCLVCRNCESVCPAGVEFGSMMEHTRDELARVLPPGPLARLARWVGFRLILPNRFALRSASLGLRMAQRWGLIKLVALFGGVRGKALAAQPPVPTKHERRPLPATTLAEGAQTGAAAMLTGCVMPEWLGRVNRATAHVLSASGCQVSTAAGHTCCGALHAHNGELDQARELARGTIEAFDALQSEDGTPLPVVVNSAGCGAHMREYDQLLADDPVWKARAESFSARVRDLSEFLTEGAPAERLQERLATGPGAAALGQVAYDDPCHLCHGQGVRSQPRSLLDSVPQLERTNLDEPEACCGSAGIYSILRPADSQGILATKLEDLAQSGAETLVTANPGCQLQWTSGLAASDSPIRVLHLAELLSQAISLE